MIHSTYIHICRDGYIDVYILGRRGKCAKMLTTGELRWRLNKNSLYSPYNFSENLKVFQNKSFKSKSSIVYPPSSVFFCPEFHKDINDQIRKSLLHFFLTSSYSFQIKKDIKAAILGEKFYENCEDFTIGFLT